MEPLYKEKYPHLFSPYTIGNVTFKNRIFTAAQGYSPGIDPSGYYNLYACEHYAARAKGGAAVVTTGENRIEEIGGGHNLNTFNLYDKVRAPRMLNHFVDFIHVYGAKASIELCHGGQFIPKPQDGSPVYGPSTRIMPDGTQVYEMPEEEMQRLAEAFANGVSLAKTCGFDMCMLHAGHGWLLSQFLSPYENQRTDRYGGSLENRARFPIMVIDAIRKAVGPGFPIELRISAIERNVDGTGMTLEESVEFVKMVEDKVDIVQCSTGTRRNYLSRGYMHPSRFLPYGSNLPSCKAMKEGGVKIPVTAMGGIYSPDFAEAILAEGIADFVSTVRGWIADPNWVEKARAGRAEDIRPCIRCLRCLDVGSGPSKRNDCAINPEFGRTYTLPYFPEHKKQKKVDIVGGGPGGMQAALSAVEKGYTVKLYEQSDRLGGQLSHIDGVEFKQALADYRDWLIRQVQKSGVDVHLSTKATPELVKADNPDLVIVAIGADPVIPKISGSTGENVITAVDAYEHPEKLGDKIVVVGGGMVGCEIALHLGQQGKDVTVVELQDALAPDAGPTDRSHLLHFMGEVAKSMTNTKCLSISCDHVMCSNGEEEFVLEADTVILAVGMTPRAKERDSFWGTAFDVINIGDCNKVGTIYGAVREGYDAILGVAAREIDYK